MGPLAGIRIVEFAGIGPAPFAAMLLADLGADIIKIERAGGNAVADMVPALNRGRASVVMDLKSHEGVAGALDLVARADAVIEGFRPGVMERLGLGPETCLERNPALVYARMTGWGQTGPLAQAAGHDINYIALTGALHAIGTEAKPVPPLNLLGDFAGGSLYLALGVLAAILRARSTGSGEVVDAAIVDGAIHLMTMIYGNVADGSWLDRREANMIDGGSHFYGVYETADGKFVSIGSLEPQFYALLLDKLGLADDPGFAAQFDRRAWPDLRGRVAAAFRGKTRDEWDELMLGTDVCYAPVLSIAEAASHPHNLARGTFAGPGRTDCIAAAPRFSSAPARHSESLLLASVSDALARWDARGTSPAPGAEYYGLPLGAPNQGAAQDA